MANKPSTHVFIHDFAQCVWGGITDDASQDTPSIERYPIRSAHDDLNLGTLKMPYSYLKRGLDSFTQVMQIVDSDIGGVLDAFNTLPTKVVENTVIVFVADHGEYSGAHGMVQGKMATVYEEAWHIPLIVVDPSGRYTGDIDTIRTGLTSSVDFLNMMAGIGYKGHSWMQGIYSDIYGGRHDMLAMLKSAKAPGRPYVLFATDEIVPKYYNFDRAPTHVLGLRAESTKLGVYEKWLPLTSQIIPSSIQLEYYDYTTTGGALEVNNIANSDPRAYDASQVLLNEIVPSELQQPLPPPLRGQQLKSKAAHLAYRALIANKPAGDFKNGGLRNILGYGGMF